MKKLVKSLGIIIALAMITSCNSSIKEKEQAQKQISHIVSCINNSCPYDRDREVEVTSVSYEHTPVAASPLGHCRGTITLNLKSAEYDDDMLGFFEQDDRLKFHFLEDFAIEFLEKAEGYYGKFLELVETRYEDLSHCTIKVVLEGKNPYTTIEEDCRLSYVDSSRSAIGLVEHNRALLGAMAQYENHCFEGTEFFGFTILNMQIEGNTYMNKYIVNNNNTFQLMANNIREIGAQMVNKIDSVNRGELDDWLWEHLIMAKLGYGFRFYNQGDSQYAEIVFDFDENTGMFNTTPRVTRR